VVASDNTSVEVSKTVVAVSEVAADVTVISSEVRVISIRPDIHSIPFILTGGSRIARSSKS
jgi:hypothetical protein